MALYSQLGLRMTIFLCVSSPLVERMLEVLYKGSRRWERKIPFLFWRLAYVR